MNLDELIPQAEVDKAAQLLELLKKSKSEALALAEALKGAPTGTPGTTKPSTPKPTVDAAERQRLQIANEYKKVEAQIQSILQGRTAILLKAKATRDMDMVLARAIAKEEAAAEGSLERKQKRLSRLLIEQGRINTSTKEGLRIYDNMGKEITELVDQVSKLEQARGNFGRNVGNYASAFSGIGFQVQQVARELPSLAVSPQQFFLAISNNLPMLKDSIEQVRESNARAIKEGREVIPVSKQIVKSIFSLNTALIVVMTIFSAFGGKILKWAGDLLKGRDAADSFAGAMKSINKEIDTADVGKQVAQYKQLQRAFLDAGGASADASKFIKQYGSEMDTAGIHAKDINDLTRVFITDSGSFIKAIALRAKATAAGVLAAKEYEKAYKIDQDSENRRNQLLAEQESLMQKIRNTGIETNRDRFEANEFQRNNYDQLRAQLEAVNKELNDQTDAENKRRDAAEKNASTYTGMEGEFLAEAQKLTNGLNGSSKEQVAWLQKLQEELKKVQEEYVAEGDAAAQAAKNQRERALADEIKRVQGLGIPHENSSGDEANIDIKERERRRKLVAAIATDNRKAQDKLAEDNLDMWAQSNKEIADDETQSLLVRAVALREYYDTQKKLAMEAAGNQRENIIQGAIDKAGVDDKGNPLLSRLEAEKAVAPQIEALRMALGMKLNDYEAKFAEDRLKIEDDAIQKAIEAQRRASAERANQMDLDESNELTALSEAYKNRELIQKEYKDEQLRIQREYAVKRATAELEAMEDQLAALQGDTNISPEQAQAILNLEAAIAKKRVDIAKDANDIIRQDNENAWGEWADYMENLGREIERWGGVAVDILSTIASAMQNATDRGLAELDKQQDAAEKASGDEKERIEQLAEAGAISEEQKNARIALADQQLEATQEQIEQRRIELRRRQAQYDKAASLAQAIVNGALSVTAALTVPPPVGPILAAINAGLAAAQVAIIAAQPLPQYAMGTPKGGHPGGLAWIGDGGRSEMVISGGMMFKSPAVPTLVDLPKGAEVLPDYTTALRDMQIAAALTTIRQDAPREPQKINVSFNEANVLSRFTEANTLARKTLSAIEQQNTGRRFKEFKIRSIN